MKNKLWMLFAILLVLAFIMTGCRKNVLQEAVEISEPVSQYNMRQTMLYFLDENDYILPVQAELPWEDGIGKAALNMLIDNDEKDVKLSSMGLFPPVPSGVTFDLDIQDHIATVDIQTNGSELPKGIKQKKMLACICNTLLCFESVNSVRVRIDGVDYDTVTNQESGEYTETVTNIEPIGSDESETVEYANLYFISATGDFLVPVKRMVGVLTPVNIVNQLLTPSIGTTLSSPLPPTVDVLSVTVDGSTVVIDLSKEFEQVAEDATQEKLVLAAFNNSLCSLATVEQVKLLINGKEYNPVVETMAGNSFYNILD